MFFLLWISINLLRRFSYCVSLFILELFELSLCIRPLMLSVVICLVLLFLVAFCYIEDGYTSNFLYNILPLILYL